MVLTARLLFAAFALLVACLFAFQASALVLGGSPDWGYAASRSVWGLWAYLVLYALACVRPDAPPPDSKEPT